MIMSNRLAHPEDHVRTRSVPAASSPRQRAGLGLRVILFALLVVLEAVLLPLALGTDGLAMRLTPVAPWMLRASLAFASLFATAAWLKHRPALAAISADLADSPISLRFLVAHVLTIATFGFLSIALFPRPSFGQLAIAWFVAGLGATAFAGCAAIPPLFWLRIVRGTGSLWIWASLAAVLLCTVGTATQALWPSVTGITFRLAQTILHPFLPGMFSDPSNLVIGTQRFGVRISTRCSGLEGLALISAFGVAWLAIFRRELRFPHALVVLPVGMAVVFVLNAVRIAALVLIGDAGAKQVAIRGFHSAAGWIVFNLVAVGFFIAARKVRWLRVAEPGGAVATQLFENPTTRWIVPFLAILGAGMISSALTGNFEWFYPLRVFAGGTTLLVLWRRYADLDWRVSWFAPITGAVVFLIWIALDLFNPPVPEAMPVPLADASSPARVAWLACRVLGAVVTVPLAEELAFRGFLYRRLLSADFESVSSRRFSWLALLGSSLIFGLLHGNHWIVATLAGALYALALLRRGRIVDAVVAHATTNALIAVDVLVFQKWHLW